MVAQSMRRAREGAKNDLEAAIYRVRNELSDKEEVLGAAWRIYCFVTVLLDTLRETDFNGYAKVVISSTVFVPHIMFCMCFLDLVNEGSQINILATFNKSFSIFIHDLYHLYCKYSHKC